MLWNHGPNSVSKFHQNLNMKYLIFYTWNYSPVDTFLDDILNLSSSLVTTLNLPSTSNTSTSPVATLYLPNNLSHSLTLCSKCKYGNLQNPGSLHRWIKAQTFPKTHALSNNRNLLLIIIKIDPFNYILHLAFIGLQSNPT